MPSFNAGSITVRVRFSTWRFKLLCMTHRVILCLTTESTARLVVIWLEKLLCPVITVRIN